MALLIFQIIVACFLWLDLLVLSVTLFFLLKTYGYHEVARLWTIVLPALLIVCLINIASFGYLHTWTFTFFEGCCALFAFFVGGYVFKQLPVYMSIRNKIRGFFMLESIGQSEPLREREDKDTTPLQEKTVSEVLTAKQKEKLKEMLNAPDIFCNKEFTAKEFAKQVGTNVSYLNRYLKQQFAMAASEYIISRRLDKAEKILAETNNSILDICDSIGFKSPTSLFNLFKKRHGMSPLQWRKHKQSQTNLIDGK